MTDILFADLGLAEPILRTLTAREHTTPTPIQVQAIPELLNGRDMLGIAQTGTGKTGAFSLPILHRMSTDPKGRRGKSPRALILAPTRELAIQIGDEIAAYGKGLGLFHTVIFGGVSQLHQVKALTRGVDIIVATPGRLLDLINQRHVALGSIEHLVLDEADRMLDMGFIRDVRKIVAALPKERQSLLFSATMPDDISKLAAEILNNPLTVETARKSMPIERIKQSVYHVGNDKKIDVLLDALASVDMSRVIVFTRTKHRANRVAEQLEKAGVNADAIHGNKSQGARQRALRSFRDGQIRVLVATDIAARGIDVDDVSHVVNFELPNEPESYVHRIGRTARAGNEGVAISLCDAAEVSYLRDIEKLIGTSIHAYGTPPANVAGAPGGRPKQNRGGGKPNHGGGRADGASRSGPRRGDKRRRPRAA